MTEVPNLDPSRTSGGRGQRFVHLSDRPAGGGEPSSQAFRVSRTLVEMPCFV
jgi:hypothetical protein